MQLRNLTPHVVNLLDENDLILRSIKSEGKPLRLTSETVLDHIEDNVPFTRTIFGKCEDLPEFQKGVYLIVSNILAMAHPERKDLVTPDRVVRSEDGQTVLGCRSFAVR